MNELKTSIQTKASQCVKCGLCAPVCPTYKLTQQEGDSPRGRISLLDGYARGDLSLSQNLKTHIDTCLTCRACEAVCPSAVNYGELLDQGRELIAIQKPPRFKFLFNALKYTWIMNWLAPFTIKNRNLKSSINLFVGCVMPWLDRKTIKAAIKLLSACGYQVRIPKSQVCCGALPLHQGLKKLSDQLTEKNKRAFNYPIVALATGCSLTLKETAYDQSRYDILEFLMAEQCLTQLKFKPIKAVALIHIPCTLKNGLKQPVIMRELLTHIPHLELIDLKTKDCCGAAGLSMLTQRTHANTLGEKILEEIKIIKPNYFVTANIGCALHLKRLIKCAKLKTKVVHPVQLLQSRDQ